MPVSEWHGDELRAATVRAAEKGLNGAAAVLVASVKAKLGARGASYKMLRRGRAILRALQRGSFGNALFPEQLGKRSRRDYNAAFEETKIGRVDDAGGYPRLRTGALRAATAFEKTGELRREVGTTTARGAHKYAGVHEFGSAAIGHPEMNIPARPVWGPSLRGEKDTMMEGFIVAAAKEFGESGASASGGAE